MAGQTNIPFTSPDPAKAAEDANQRGIDLSRQGRLEEAKAQFYYALQLNPQYVNARVNLGLALVHLQRYAEGLAQYQEVLRLNPDHAEAHYHMGYTWHRQGKLPEASACYRQAVRIKPDHVEALNNLGIALMDQRKLDEALVCFQQALKFNPNHVDAQNNLGIAFLDLGRLGEAEASYRQALRLAPGLVDALGGLGVVLTHQAKFDEALACFEQGLRIDCNHAETHLNRAIVWLLRGHWAVGWREYEWRWQTKMFPRYSFRQPRWNGAALQGRTILLLAEQGLGDTFQFIRYVPLIQNRGGKVVIQCQTPLQRILTNCFSEVSVVPRGKPLPQFDVYVPLMSLPGIMATTPETVPAPIPYLNADPQLVEQWGLELEPLKGLRIGIAWQGSPSNRLDRQRSIPLANFEGLARLPGVHLISLQKGPGADQLAGIAAKLRTAGYNAPLDVSGRLDETAGPFMDTAAIIKNLDLVISADTVVPHLAGALGIPVWVALPLVPDWRWLLQRPDTPWYPTMRLFRQSKLGQWDDVFSLMARELSKLGKTVEPQK